MICRRCEVSSDEERCWMCGRLYRESGPLNKPTVATIPPPRFPSTWWRR